MRAADPEAVRHVGRISEQQLAFLAIHPLDPFVDREFPSRPKVRAVALVGGVVDAAENQRQGCDDDEIPRQERQIALGGVDVVLLDASLYTLQIAEQLGAAASGREVAQERLGRGVRDSLELGLGARHRRIRQARQGHGGGNQQGNDAGHVNASGGVPVLVVNGHAASLMPCGSVDCCANAMRHSAGCACFLRAIDRTVRMNSSRKLI